MIARETTGVPVSLGIGVVQGSAHEDTTEYEKAAYGHSHDHTQRSSSVLPGETIPEKKAFATDVTLNVTHDNGGNDLEATRTAESTGPPYSVFTLKEKRLIIFLTAWAGFFSPLSANIYFPALNALAADLHVSNSLINLTLTSYMIFQGIAPTIFGDLADSAGRRPAYLIGFTIYIAANIGIATQNSFAALFVLRCLQSTGSSATVALGSGVVADISTSAERGTYMGWATTGESTSLHTETVS